MNMKIGQTKELELTFCADKLKIFNCDIFVRCVQTSWSWSRV